MGSEILQYLKLVFFHFLMCQKYYGLFCRKLSMPYVLCTVVVVANRQPSHLLNILCSYGTVKPSFLVFKIYSSSSAAVVVAVATASIICRKPAPSNADIENLVGSLPFYRHVCSCCFFKLDANIRAKLWEKIKKFIVKQKLN
jgi:hypothetical protein